MGHMMVLRQHLGRIPHARGHHVVDAAAHIKWYILGDRRHLQPLLALDFAPLGG